MMSYVSYNDTRLFDRWRANHDAEALHELIRRHSSMVYATCLRLLRNTHDAEEIAQDTFIALMSASSGVGTYIGPWLHRVATNRCLDRAKAQARRRARELRVTNSNNTQETIRWDDIRDFVDEAIASLPDAERAAIVAHFLEGRTHKAIAQELGVTRQAVSHRVSTGVDKIREQLRRKGVPVAAVIFGALLTENASAAIPSALSVSLGKMAVAGVDRLAASGTSLSLGSASVRAVLGGLMVKKAVVAVGLVILVVYGWYGFVRKPAKNPKSTPITVMKHEEPAAPATHPSTHPVASVAKVGKLGATQIRLANTVAKTSAPFRANAPQPGKSRVRLERGEIADPSQYASIAGVVTDTQGQPIDGAEVSVFAPGYIPKGKDSGDRGAFDLLFGLRHFAFATTKSDGSYRVTGIAFTNYVILAVNAPGYFLRRSPKALVKISPGAHLDNVNLVLEPGQSVDGVVLSSTRLPAPGATIYCEDTGFVTISKGDGSFSVTLPPNIKRPSFWVIHPTFGKTYFQSIQIPQDGPLELVMSGKATVQGRVTLHGGQPAAGYTVQLDGRLAENDGLEGRLPPYKAVTNGQGDYAVKGVESMYYIVRVFDGNGTPVTELTDLGLLPAGRTRTWDCKLTRPMKVHGVVRGQTEQRPEPGVYVVCASDGLIRNQTKTDKDGSYTLAVFSGPGSYVIAPSGTNPPSNGQLPDDWASFAKPIEVVPGSQVTVDLTTPDTFTAEAFFLDENDKPVTQGIQVKAWMMDGATLTSSDVLHPDSTGGYKWDGFMPGLRCYFNARPNRKSPYVYTTTAVFTQRPPGPNGQVVAHLYQPAQLGGRLIGPDGAPLAGTPFEANLELANGQAYGTVNATTKADGTFLMKRDPHVLTTEIPATTFRVTLVWVSPEKQLYEWKSGLVGVEPGQLVDLGNVQVRLRGATAGAQNGGPKGPPNPS